MTFLNIHTTYRNALLRRLPRGQFLAERKQQQEMPLPAPRTSFGEAAARLFGRMTIADPPDGEQRVHDVLNNPQPTDEEFAAQLAREYKGQQEREDRLMAEGMNEWMDDWKTKPPKTSPIKIATMEDHACPSGMSGGLPDSLTTGGSGKMNGNRVMQNSKAVTPGTTFDIPSSSPATSITIPMSLPISTTPVNPSPDSSPLRKDVLQPDRPGSAREDLETLCDQMAREQWETSGGQAVLGDFDTYTAMTQDEQNAMRRKIQREENYRAIREKMAMAKREREENDRVKEKGNKRVR